MGVMACTKFRHKGRYIHNGKSTLEHDLPTGPYLYLYQILSKYFKPHTQEFDLEIHSGEVTRKQQQQRLSLLHDQPTCPYLCLYKILSQYFKH